MIAPESAAESAAESALSPWQVTLGEAFTELHPRLRTYFQAIPRGSIGVGDGVFDTVGTPRGWLRLLIRFAVDADVLFPVWERDVPFSVANRPSGSAGRPAVTAERSFMFDRGSGVMRDRIVATPDGIVDVLGAHRRFRALFVSQVVVGGLRLTSTRVALRIGRRHVSLSMHAPLVGKVYEYAGSFRYVIRSEKA